jgi:hypothetical protein
MTVARKEEKLKLGKRPAFAKAHLQRLRQEDKTWEADFRGLPKPVTQSQTHYRGTVVSGLPPLRQPHAARSLGRKQQ